MNWDSSQWPFYTQTQRDLFCCIYLDGKFREFVWEVVKTRNKLARVATVKSFALPRKNCDITHFQKQTLSIYLETCLYSLQCKRGRFRSACVFDQRLPADGLTLSRCWSPPWGWRHCEAVCPGCWRCGRTWASGFSPSSSTRASAGAAPWDSPWVGAAGSPALPPSSPERQEVIL